MSKQRKRIKKCCSAVNTELFLVGHLNIDLMFLKGGIFAVVAHVHVSDFPLGKSAVICDTVIFGAVPGSCQIFSKWRCRENLLCGGNSSCLNLQVWNSVLEASWIVGFPLLQLEFSFQKLGDLHLEVFFLLFSWHLRVC